MEELKSQDISERNQVSAYLPKGKQLNRLFPVFLKLEHMQVLLVGGGNVALEKLKSLLVNSPDTFIYLVAPEIHPEIIELAAQHERVKIHKRVFLPGDLSHKDLVILALGNLMLSESIRTMAKAERLLVNVADTPELCDFYLGSVVQKGHIKIAVSTNGKSPTLAKRLREFFNDIIPEDISDLAQVLNEKRSALKGDFSEKVKQMNELTKPLSIPRSRKTNWKRIAKISVRTFALMLVGHFLLSYSPIEISLNQIAGWIAGTEKLLIWVFLAGFLAQLIDGALGMGYGVTSTTILLSAGVNIPAISASVHTAEIFASGASGYSHYKFGNVNKKLFKILVIPGVIGAILGAVLLVHLGESHLNWLRPLMALYTSVLGLRILFLAFREQARKTKKFKRYMVLAWSGGFLDSFGGGGWGPIVTSTLITSGRNPKYVIGSVSVTEFFVTMASAVTFFTILGISHWKIIIALIAGGILAAPIAAKLAGRLPRKISFILLSILVLFWSIRILMQSV